MSKKSFFYAVHEGIRQAMGAEQDVMLTSNDKITFLPVKYPGMPDIDLLKEHGPNRVFGYERIDEMWYTAMGLGSALVGNKVVIHNYAAMANAFPWELWSQHAAKLPLMTGGQASVNMVLWLNVSAQGAGSAAQHSDYEEDTWYAHVPGARTVVAGSVYNAKGLMISAIRSGDPVAFITPDSMTGLEDDVPDTAYEVPIGKASILTRGSDITVVSSGAGMLAANAAVKKLIADGVGVELIDLTTLNPMDTETIVKSVQKTRRLVTFDQSKHTLSPGAEVVARACEAIPSGIKARRIAWPDSPPPGAPEMFLWLKPNETQLIDAAKRLLG